MFLGTEDKLIPVDTAKKFQQQLRQTGAACQLHLYEGQPHGFFNHGRNDNKYYRETVAAADKFLVELGWIPAK